MFQIYSLRICISLRSSCSFVTDINKCLRLFCLIRLVLNFRGSNERCSENRGSYIASTVVAKWSRTMSRWANHMESTVMAYLKLLRYKIRPTVCKANTNGYIYYFVCISLNRLYTIFPSLISTHRRTLLFMFSDPWLSSISRHELV
jgi:hypothetical protein